MGNETVDVDRRNQTVEYYRNWYRGIQILTLADYEVLDFCGLGWNDETVVPDKWADKMKDIDSALRDLSYNEVVKLVEAAYGDEPDLGRTPDQRDDIKKPEFLEKLGTQRSELVWSFIMAVYYGELQEMLSM